MHALHPIWRAKDISNQTKIALYMSLVLSIVLYAAETCTLRKRNQDRLLSFEMSCLRRILGISRRDRIRNDNIRQRLDLETTIMVRNHSRRLTYYGHVIRMYNNRLPLITLFGSTRGTRPKGRPPKRWIDCCKESCMTRGIASLTDARWLRSSRIGRSGEPSAVAATLTELSPGQKRLKSSKSYFYILYFIIVFKLCQKKITKPTIMRGWHILKHSLSRQILK